ncbi:hypothetical protein [Actinoplanes regularis]|uniref:Uncharacterized protein n=1 Tax=Actinoplanes regularis TaxID=52697 RepID=A0A239DS70_9ACTN|nr:hypothetical protein [Actinoplanes regularis]GIE89027.1 hypothetical protein Are01nite_55070 [Actinoplanes regularis]SNS35366.1 hypothetical protein SAMN06264365_11478 [Actinoplanes regularis]
MTTTDETPPPARDGSAVSGSGDAHAATGGLANSGAIDVKVETTYQRGRTAWWLLAFVAAAVALLLAWEHRQAVFGAEPLNPTPAASTGAQAGPPAQPTGTHQEPGSGNAAVPAPVTTAPRAGESATPASEVTSSPSPSPTTAQKSVAQNCNGQFTLRAGMGADLATCKVGSGSAFADVLFTDAGTAVGDGISTRTAGKGGSLKYTSYETCRGTFRSATHPTADLPITTAACLMSDRSVAYIDVIDRDSTRMVVNLLAWKLKD